MAKFHFTKNPDPDNPYDTSRIHFESSAVTLNELLADLECFIRGCGFVPEGTLDFVHQDDDFREVDF